MLVWFSIRSSATPLGNFFFSTDAAPGKRVPRTDHADHQNAPPPTAGNRSLVNHTNQELGRSQRSGIYLPLKSLHHGSGNDLSDMFDAWDIG